MTKTSTPVSVSSSAATVVYTDASAAVIARLRAMETPREREDREQYERESASEAYRNSGASRTIARLALSVRVEGALHTRDEHAGPQSHEWWEGTVADLLEEVDTQGTGCGCCSPAFRGQDATGAIIRAGSELYLYASHERTVAYVTAYSDACGELWEVTASSSQKRTRF